YRGSFSGLGMRYFVAVIASKNAATWRISSLLRSNFFIKGSILGCIGSASCSAFLGLFIAIPELYILITPMILSNSPLCIQGLVFITSLKDGVLNLPTSLGSLVTS